MIQSVALSQEGLKKMSYLSFEHTVIRPTCTYYTYVYKNYVYLLVEQRGGGGTERKWMFILNKLMVKNNYPQTVIQSLFIHYSTSWRRFRILHYITTILSRRGEGNTWFWLQKRKTWQTVHLDYSYSYFLLEDVKASLSTPTPKLIFSLNGFRAQISFSPLQH